jgi:HAD superfamily hydrolase (TIGR01509 family)
MSLSRFPQAIIFDFDGVLMNSEPLHFFAFKEALRLEGIELTEEQYYRDYIGFDDRGAFHAIYADRARPLDGPTFLRVNANKQRKMMEQIHGRKYKPLDGVEAFVRGLWRHYPLGICSGAIRDEIEAMLEGAGLRDCFRVIVAAEDVTVGKPDPQGYLLAARLLAQQARKPIAPSDCLVVEDAPTVIRSARAAGFRVLGVATTCRIEALQGADWAVASLNPRLVAQKIPDLRIAQ